MRHTADNAQSSQKTEPAKSSPAPVKSTVASKTVKKSLDNVSFSLKSMLGDDKSDATRSGRLSVSLRNGDFSEEQLNTAWFSLPKVIPEKLMLHRFFAVPPILENGNSLVLSVDNEIVAEEIKSVMPLLLSALRDSLKNDRIEISLRITEAQGLRLATNEDKLKYLSEQNHDLRDLVVGLDMTFD